MIFKESSSMRQAFRSGLLGALALAAAAACGPARTTAAWAATHTMKHDVGAAVAGAALQPGEPVHVAVTLQMRHQPEMDALTAALLSGRATRHISSAEFLEHFAPTEAQAEAVVAHLRSAGFTNIEVAGNRMLVSADGDAATVEAAFDTPLRHFTVDGRERYANTADARVPAHLAGIVNAVLGLQNVHAARTMLRRPDPSSAQADPLTKVGHDPTEFPAIYDATALPSATAGTIGIISEGDITQTIADLDTFAANSGFPAPTIHKIVVGAAGTDTSGVVEWNMDSQVSLSAAGGHVKAVNFYVATTLDAAPLTAAYNRAVTDNVAKAVNVSLGECETAAKNSGEEASDDAIFQIAMAQGQVFSVSSGDSGSFTCGSKKGGQSYPSVSPYVISLGGTSLSTTNQTTWAGETVWACSGALGCEILGGAGGGASATEAAPQWQLDAGVLGASTKRGIPDVSFVADPATGAMVLVGTKSEQVGGTSLAAPLFTGFWLRVQGDNGNALVFPANALYQYGPANSKKMFHDVKSGSNGGYTAAAGWDYASGFGSLDVGKFDNFVKHHSGF
jgi:pseudomonalisin/xanthomonalisin